MSETLVCLGTKTVPLRDKENGTEQEGLVAIFHQASLSAEEAATASQRLQVNVTDGTAVYRGEMEMDRVKMKLLDALDDDKTKQALRMAGYLLHDTVAQIEPTYTYVENNNNTIQLVIKYQHSSGENDEDAAMKKAWSGSLTRITNTNGDNDLLHFSTALGNSINQERRNRAQLRQTMEVVQTDRAAWKETADQLSGKWDSEKDTLFYNFATLYNKTRQELAATRTQVRDLQTQLEISEANNNNNNTNKEKARPPKRAKKQISFQEDDEEMPDQPDDNHNLFDASMANALASGNRVDINIQREKATEPSSKKARGKRKVASDSDDDDGSGVQQKKTSSKTILAFDDDSDDDSVAKKIRAQIAAGDMNTSSDEDDGNNINNNNAVV